jgi:hypothetical protein
MFEEVAKLQQTFTSSAKHANLPCASVEPSSSVLSSRQIGEARFHRTFPRQCFVAAFANGFA